jgi:hypothetical protein
MSPFVERAPLIPAPQICAGFYRVPVGTLVEMGDQYLDGRGRICTVSLDQIGQRVTAEQMILRVERRHPHD